MPTEPAYPLHPNGKGEASMARSVIAALGAPAESVPPVPARHRRVGGRRDAQCWRATRAVGRGRRPGAARAHAPRARRRVRVAPAKRTRLARIWCTRGGAGRVAAVFSGRSRPRARRDGADDGAVAKAFRRAYPAPPALGGPVPRLAAQRPAHLGAPRAGSLRRGHGEAPVPADRAAGPRPPARARLSQLFQATGTGPSPAPA